MNYIELLKEFEGYYEKPYLCTKDRCTIGYGTNLDVHRKFIPCKSVRESNLKGKVLRDKLLSLGMRWTKEQAEEAMLEELNKTKIELKQRCKEYNILLEKSDEVRANILLDMAYNMGTTGLLKFKNMLSAVDRGDYKSAAEHMKDSNWYRQVGRRSKALVNMMISGKYPESV